MEDFVGEDHKWFKQEARILVHMVKLDALTIMFNTGDTVTYLSDRHASNNQGITEFWLPNGEEATLGDRPIYNIFTLGKYDSCVPILKR
jgi:hypothetical protein